MYSADQTILDSVKTWLAHDTEVLLVTVARTWGSSPRPVGAMMAIRENGEATGSVSGGCIEEDLIHKYRAKEIPSRPVSTLSYGVGQLDAQKFGLPCGGTLELVLERVQSFEILQAIIDAVNNDTCICRTTNIKTGLSSYAEADWYSSTCFDEPNLHRVFGPQWNLLLIGANDLAKNIAMLAHPLGYRTIVCDPREIADISWINDKISFRNNMPDDVVATLTPCERSIVLALTHDPKMDDMALMQALQMNLFYVGAIGSVKTQTARKKRLQQLDLTDEQIAKLHGPIGFPIGSKQPLEIAISVLAQLTQLRNRRSQSLSRQSNYSRLA